MNRRIRSRTHGGVGGRRSRGLPLSRFISHFHIDHIAGLHTIALNTFSKGLSILIQDGGTELLNRIICLPYTIPLEDLPFETKILEVPQRRMDLPFKAEFLPMVHPVFTLGVRLEVDDKVITYCPDTGYCDNALKLALNADLLIADCAYKPTKLMRRGLTSIPKWQPGLRMRQM